MRAFVAWHRQRHLEDLNLLDEYFDLAEFEKEVASLPSKYSPAGGQLLLAYYGNEPAGCVALRRIDEQACEMKRMFLYPHTTPRALVARLVNQSSETPGRLDIACRR
jgi:putative acetyltransferase